MASESSAADVEGANAPAEGAEDDALFASADIGEQDEDDGEEEEEEEEDGSGAEWPVSDGDTTGSFSDLQDGFDE